MKKNFKFMLVALLAVFGFGNAMAAELVNSTQYDTNGFQYVIKSMTKAGDTWTGTVSMKQNTFSGTSITINPTVNITVEGSVSGVDCKGNVTFKIVEIEANGFAGLSDVTSITFAEGCNIETIGAGAFAETAIEDLDLTKTKITTLNRLFEQNNVTLKSVELPTTITTLAENALADCIQLSSVSFEDCTNLATLGNGSLSNTIVSSYDFEDCVNLTNLGSVTPFVNATTTTNKNLQTVVLPKTSAGICPVTAIGTAFANCEVLKTITNLNVSQITTLGDKAFEKDINLTSLEFPSTLTSVNGSPFTGCVKLAELIFNNAGSSLTIGDAINNIYGTETASLAALTTLKIVVPVTDPLTTANASISENALKNCTGITTLEIAKDGNYVGTIATFALSETANASITFGNITDAASVATLTGPKGTYTTELVIGVYNPSTDFTAAIVDGIVSKATVGAVKNAGVLIALGQAQEIKFKGDITTVALAAPSTPNNALTTLDFGTSVNEDAINITASFIAAAVFNGTNAPNLTSVTWKPADASATKAFAKAAFGASSVGTSAKVTLHTTTAVGDGFYELKETNLYNVIFDAEAAAATPIELEVYGTADADYYYGKMLLDKKVEIAKTNDDGDQVEVYSAFVDTKDQKIYMVSLSLKNGLYVVAANQAVILRVKTPTTTADYAKVAGSKVAIVKAYESNKYNTMRYIPTGGGSYKIVNDLQVTDKIFSSDYIGTNYVGKTLFAMANPAKIGTLQFDKVEKTSYLPKNALFVETAEEVAAARLNVVWLDENEATGLIENIMDKTANDGAVYNLQGVRVNGAQKGIYIKNGKKFIVK